jgi:hypothetical protein
MIELEAGDARVEVAVTDGGRLRQITVAGVGLLHDHPSGGPLTCSGSTTSRCNCR